MRPVCLGELIYFKKSVYCSFGTKPLLFKALKSYQYEPMKLWYAGKNHENWNWFNYWGRVMHICVSKLTIIGSDNGLSPGRRQAIVWTNDGILLTGTLGTNLSEILSKINTFSFKKMHLKMTSVKWRPFCLGLNVLIKRFLKVMSGMWLPFGSGTIC